MMEKFPADDKVDHAAAPSPSPSYDYDYHYDDDDDNTNRITPPPPFSSSFKDPAVAAANAAASRSSLHTQLAETRTRRIQNLLATAIEPLVYSQLLEGIYKRALVIIPSDIFTTSTPPHHHHHHHHQQQPPRRLLAKDIVFPPTPNAGDVCVIQLEGDENRAAFWHRPDVPQELASSLRARLAAVGHDVVLDDDDPDQPALPTGPAAHHPQQQQQQQLSSPSSSSWVRTRFGTPGPTHDPTATINYKLGWRSEDEDRHRHRPRTTLGRDQVRVSARVRDVSFRVETEMGLLDSVTGRVLWLELEVGI